MMSLYKTIGLILFFVTKVKGAEPMRESQFKGFLRHSAGECFLATEDKSGQRKALYLDPRMCDIKSKFVDLYVSISGKNISCDKIKVLGNKVCLLVQDLRVAVYDPMGQ